MSCNFHGKLFQCGAIPAKGGLLLINEPVLGWPFLYSNHLEKKASRHLFPINAFRHH